MSVITQKEVRTVANLARIALTDGEVAQTAKDLSGILGHFASIGDIDTSNVLPADDVSGLVNITREDTVKPNNLCAAQELVQGYVQVPGVFEESSIS